MGRVHLLVGAMMLLLTPWGDAFERTESREPCRDVQPLKRPLFGDLHAHSSYSYDSYLSNQRNTPWEAYSYARGEPITLPNADGEQTIVTRIPRPLDFAAMTEHAEFLGEVSICSQDPGEAGYYWPMCAMIRSDNLWVQLLGANWFTRLAGYLGSEPERSFACTLSDCDAAHVATWEKIQRAAEEHYDRSSSCEFTTLVGYEYTDAPNQNNMHRNVIFRNERVPATAFSGYDTGPANFPELWRRLRTECIEAGNGCDVMSIPHNPNLSGGLMFRDPRTELEVTERRFFEPLVEITQHKGASECRYDRLLGQGLGTEDELCTFEQIDSDNLNMLGSVHGEVRTDRANMVPMEEFGRRNMVRNTLKDGLALERESGTNPFVMGFIGSTDTHSATPGATEEYSFVGHLGRRDAEYRNVQDHFFSQPGGHAVVWAEENSRDAIFEALRRKETYATSGTRPVVRFFGGIELDADLCDNPAMSEAAYQQGVPMGGQVTLQDNNRPRLMVSAHKDPGVPGHPGTNLQRIQIVKGWIDEQGNTHERVFDVAGDADGEAGVNPETCAPSNTGYASLCAVWQDEQAVPGENAFYYARVLENPSCRWSTLQCQAAGVNPFSESCASQAEAATLSAHERGAEGDVYGKCCINEADQPFYSPVIQERAWTSPIWFNSASLDDETP